MTNQAGLQTLQAGRKVRKRMPEIASMAAREGLLR
jgi:hypothetical protein